MANSKDITGRNANILLVGDSKIGKTRFLRTVPDLYVFDFDAGMASLRDVSVEYDTFKDLDKGVVATPAYAKLGLYEYGLGWRAFWKKMQDLSEIISQGKGPKAIAFDSLTFMSMLAVNDALRTEGKGLTLPHQGTWGAHHGYFKAVFSQVTALPVRIIATAHIERKENDLLQVTEKLPLLAGKMAGMISAFFDETYYLEKAPNGVTVLRTAQTREIKAGSRWNVPDGVRADFGVIEPCFRGEPPTEAPVLTAKAAAASAQTAEVATTIKL